MKSMATGLFLIFLIASINPVDAIDVGPANEINILSGGSSNLLKSPTAKMAIKYVAPADITLDKVMLLPGCGIPATNQPSWSVQIQTNSGSYPSGTALGKGTLTNPKDDVWSTVDISPNVALKKGQTYWIVVQYLSGPTPTSTKSWLGLYASKPTPDGTLTNIRLPYNYAGTNKGINDITAKTNIAYFNGKI
ncbi:choice-of-anchor R domain-containing protein, partial [Methanolobus chelungpuianus]